MFFTESSDNFVVAKPGRADRYEYLDPLDTEEAGGIARVFALQVSSGPERQPPDHRVIAEAGTDPVDGVLGDGGAAVNQVGGIGLVRCDQRTRADADQPEARAVGLALEQVARGSKNAAGELGRLV